MKNLYLIVLITFTSAVVQANTHEILINAIIESDYETFVTTYSKEPISQKEHANLLDYANQIIPFRQRWAAEHAWQPQLDEELITAAIYAVPMGIGIAILALIEEDLNRQKNSAGIAALFGFSLIIPSAYLSIKKLVVSFQKPKILLSNSMRIKDYLLSI